MGVHIAWPRLIYDSGQLVGFIMAAFAPEHQNPLFHSCLWRLNMAPGARVEVTDGSQSKPSVMRPYGADSIG
jgi:hypothetical protein